MATQDWLLVGMLLAIVGGSLYVGNAVNGHAGDSGLLLIGGLVVGLGGYAIARPNASAARD
ncbi:hypothetical protein [Halomarina oriensis]|uniref:Uncharacterized protein n=1 Tax=Halomarina oriensis TaxID=671145 RepID=A0A6B0GQ28_9EURY|nr:hypothetical protein [Halomarina oriensis]MWG35689.1 hypothetical protein [Halomarina oriensis]